MSNSIDDKDKKQSRIILITLILLVVILVVGIFLLMPLLNDIIASSFSPGLGLKDSAILSFFITLILMIILALVSGDGILGEVQFLLLGFLVFFIIIWLMLAWVF